VKKIGRITKTYGYEGAVVVRSESGITGEPEQGEPVFVVIDGIPVPFFTREAFSPSPDTLVISFDDYLTTESVAALKGCEVHTAAGETDADDDLSGLTGYTLTDSNSSIRGVITSVIKNPGQLLAVVSVAGEEIYIPLHPDLILSVDQEKKLIEMSLPEGLAGLND
jgi:16S rRNA processing protein RimM